MSLGILRVAQTENKIYGKAVFIADCVLIVSQQTKKSNSAKWATDQIQINLLAGEHKRISSLFRRDSFWFSVLKCF